MGAEGIEPPTDGLEPSILPLDYAPLENIEKTGLKIYSLFNCSISSLETEHPLYFIA